MTCQPERAAAAKRRITSVPGDHVQSDEAAQGRLGEEGDLANGKSIRVVRSELAELELRAGLRPSIAFDRAEPRAETPMIPRSGAWADGGENSPRRSDDQEKR
jgi:hypothetical protein